MEKALLVFKRYFNKTIIEARWRFRMSCYLNVMKISTKKEYIVVFDGVCNLCNSTVKWIIKRDRNDVFRFVSAQQAVEFGILREGVINISEPDSVIILDGDKIYNKSDAAIFIAVKLGFPYNLASVFRIVPAMLRNVAYNYVARNRYKWFGKKNECMIPTPQLQSKFITQPGQK